MKLLAIETATRRISVALWIDGVVAERSADAPNSGSGLVLPWVYELLAEAGTTLSAIDGVAFGAGPGGFTGLRLACGVTQGLAFGIDAPVVPVGTLAALAVAAGHGTHWTVLDARMNEVYAAAYHVRFDEAGDAPFDVIEVAAPVCVPPGPSAAPPRLKFDSGEVDGVGDGFAAYGDALRAAAPGLVGVRADVWPTAGAVARLAVAPLRAGQGVAADQALPVYVRDKVALTTVERLAQGGLR